VPFPSKPGSPGRKRRLGRISASRATRGGTASKKRSKPNPPAEAWIALDVQICIALDLDRPDRLRAASPCGSRGVWGWPQEAV